MLERRVPWRRLSGGKLAGRARTWSWRLSGFESGALPLLNVTRERVPRVEDCAIVVGH